MSGRSLARAQVTAVLQVQTVRLACLVLQRLLSRGAVRTVLRGLCEACLALAISGVSFATAAIACQITKSISVQSLDVEWLEECPSALTVCNSCCSSWQKGPSKTLCLTAARVHQTRRYLCGELRFSYPFAPFTDATKATLATGER